MEIGTTVVLADAHAMMREGMRLVLQDTGRMTVVGETGRVEEAVQLTRRPSPDILAIDSGMLCGPRGWFSLAAGTTGQDSKRGWPG